MWEAERALPTMGHRRPGPGSASPSSQVGLRGNFQSRAGRTTGGLREQVLGSTKRVKVWALDADWLV